MNGLLFLDEIAVERDEWEGKDVDHPLTEKGKLRVGIPRQDIKTQTRQSLMRRSRLDVFDVGPRYQEPRCDSPQPA